MDGLRFLFGGVLVLAPGFLIAHLLGLSRASRPARPDPALAIAAAPGLAVAAHTLIAFILIPLDAGPGLLGWWILIVAGASAVALPFVLRKAGARPDAAGWAGILAGVLLALLGLHAGASFRVTGDALDHVGTLREILTSGRSFPTEAFHVGAGALGLDPRKGLLHPVYAALAAAFHMDPVAFWRNLPAFAALVPAFAAYGATSWLGFRRGAAWLAAAFTFLAWSGGPAGDYFGIAPFPNQLGAGLLWMAAALAVRFLRDGGRRAGLAAALMTWAAVAVHPMYIVFGALVWAVAALGALVTGGDRAVALKRLLAAASMLAVPVGAYTLYRLPGFHPANPIHTELQGMLFLGRGLFVADPALMWKHLGPLGLVGYPLALVALGRRWRREPGAFLVFWGVVVGLNLTWNPLLVPALQKSLSYLVFRSFWIVPPPLAAAVAFGALLGGRRTARHPRMRLVAAALVIVALLPALRAAATPRWLTTTAAARDGACDPLPWRTDLETLASMLPARSVLLSDPVTAQAVPAFTDDRVVAGFDQHTSPNDRFARERMLLAADVLSTAVPPARARALLDSAAVRFGAPVAGVLLNTGIAPPILTAVGLADGRLAARRREQLTVSGAFTLRGEAGPFALLVPSAAAPPDSLAPPFPEPFVAIPVGVRRVALPGGNAVIVPLGVAPATVAPGDTLAVRLLWSAPDLRPEPGRTVASLRLDAVENPFRGKPLEKLLRKASERWTHRSLRARTDWMPTGGTVPPWRWERDRGVPDAVTLRIPRNLAPGRYLVSVALPRLAAMPNHRLKDYGSDDDLYAGAVIDTILVRPGTP